MSQHFGMTYILFQDPKVFNPGHRSLTTEHFIALTNTNSWFTLVSICFRSRSQNFQLKVSGEIFSSSPDFLSLIKHTSGSHAVYFLSSFLTW